MKTLKSYKNNVHLSVKLHPRKTPRDPSLDEPSGRFTILYLIEFFIPLCELPQSVSQVGVRLEAVVPF